MSRHKPIISAEAHRRHLRLRDLTDPEAGAHAMQELVSRIAQALTETWNCPAILYRGDREVSIADNYDRLGYPPGAAARDARYSRYVSADRLLRTHMSAVIPGLLRSLSADPPDDAALVCPGIVYRRDVIDRLHTGEPHQLDLWRLARRRLTVVELQEMIAAVIDAGLPGARHRTNPAAHPYTTDGLEIEVASADRWVELGECGLAHPQVLAAAGLDISRYSGLAMGLGLDRLLMLVKGIDDIRLLRSDDARVAAQMLDLAPYRPVSDQPAIRRDISVAIDQSLTREEIGDRAREALGASACHIESIEVLSETHPEDLPPTAIARLGMEAGQKNVLLRIVIRHLTRTLTSEEANRLRDRVYRAVHQGAIESWAR